MTTWAPNESLLKDFGFEKKMGGDDYPYYEAETDDFRIQIDSTGNVQVFRTDVLSASVNIDVQDEHDFMDLLVVFKIDEQ